MHTGLQRLWLVPVTQVLSDDQMFEVIVNGSFIVLKQCVGVPQTVTGLGLHGPVLQKTGQLQSPPEGERVREEEGQRMSRVDAGEWAFFLLSSPCWNSLFRKDLKHRDVAAAVSELTQKFWC